MNSLHTRTFPRWLPGGLVLGCILLALPSAAQVNFSGVLDARKGSVVVPHAAALNLAPRMTIEVWVKLARATAAYGAIIDKDYTTGFSLGIESIVGRTDSVDVAFAYGNRWAYKPRVALDSLRWLHLALSLDTLAHRYVLYLNGVEVKSATSSLIRFADNAVDLHIGGSRWGDRFSGMLDEIRIWNVVRSASEIGTLWKHGARGNEPGLLAVYHFEDERDTVAWNRSGSGGLHGTLSAKDLIVMEERTDAFINENETNSSFAQATPVNYGSWILEASIAPADTDYFKIWTGAGDVFRVESRAKNPGDPGDMSISLYGSDSVTLIRSRSGGYPAFYSAASTSGYHYVRVANKSGAGGSYILGTSYYGQTFVADEYEPNNTRVQATPRPWGVTGYGTIFPGLDAGVAIPDTDYYAYTAEAGEIGCFFHSLQGIGCGSGAISLHSPTGDLPNTFPCNTLNHRFPASGTYYVRIRPVEATYRYYWGGFKALADINNMLYDPVTIGSGTQLNEGMNSAYTTAYLLKINATYFQGTPVYSSTDLAGRQFVFGPATVNGLSVTRKFFVPTAAQGDTLGFMRIQDILTNPGAAPITVNVGVYSDLGANPSKVIATSSGDTLFTKADTWLVTDDKYPTASAPNLSHAFDGPGGADRVDSVSIVGDDLYWEWRDVTVFPGETKIYLYYVAQDSSPAMALKKGPAFAAPVLPAAAKLGLGAGAQLVMNWHTDALVSTESEDPGPLTYALHQNFPNPFNPATMIRYQLPVSGEVRLVVYDVLGREVSVLVDERKEAGVYNVTFDGANLSSGVYFYRLSAGDFVQAKKFMLVK